MSLTVPNEYRVTVGAYQTTKFDGNNGLFFVPMPDEFKDISRRLAKGTGKRITLSHYTVIVSDGLDWEHVSVSLSDRCLTWEEMCFIKNLFWDDEDAVMQLHPPQSDYVNNHEFTLHLWRPMAANIPLPPSIMVGTVNG